MRWTLDEIAAASAGRVAAPAGAAVVEGLSVDSRTVTPGQMFVALRAERDGHDFLQAAVSAGAGAVLISSSWSGPVPPDAAAVVVDDTSEALLRIGAAARRRIAGPVVGVTGSVGKTSTKDLAAAALGSGLLVVASERSFNNEIGVPLTLANSPLPVDAAVVEMGARRPGHIALLCSVAAPTIGVVTAVAAAHTEMFGTLERIAEAKGELIEALPASGTAVLNGDDDLVKKMARRGPASAVLYSLSGDGTADVVAAGIRLDPELRPSFRAITPWGAVEVALEARGLHQVANALAALAVAGAAGVDLEAAGATLRSAPLSPWRMEVHRTPGGGLVINDAYNSNPASAAAALRSLAAVPARRRVAVLGLMAELGERSTEEHQAVAALARRLGLEVVAVDVADYGVAAVAAAEVPALIGVVGPDDAVLVKGSRVAGLEKVAAGLIDG